MNNAIPLAEKLRPRNLDEVIGQDHLVGQKGIIRQLLLNKSGFIPSMIFWGPPGSGKTTLAYIIGHLADAEVEFHSAVTAKLDDVRGAVKKARERQVESNQKTILFIDEIHRFNKAQQDALLPHVERGDIIFIGATTENPSFEVISPLLSRCRVMVLKELSNDSLQLILQKALQKLKIKILKDAQDFLLEISNGDARSLLIILEIASNLIGRKKILSKNDIELASQKKLLRYDRAGDEHYDTISAFIKSMRASQTDAALYYLARMVDAGEDPLFIARRMVIFASEDIGLAQPTALVVANAVFDAANKVGYPEAQISLAHGVAYLCQAKKDRSAYNAYFSALEDVKRLGNLPIPLKVRNAPTKLMKGLGYGKGYNIYDIESYLPDKIKDKKYYNK